MKKFSIFLPLIFLFAASLACTRAGVPIEGIISTAKIEPYVADKPEEAAPKPTEAPIQPTAVEPSPTPTPTATPTPPPVYFSAAEIEEGVVGLEIPKSEVSVILATGEINTTGRSLALLEGHPEWVPNVGPEIGLEGIAFIYGHRTWGPFGKVFYNLDKLAAGDPVTVHSLQKELTFTVYESVVVDPDQVWSTIWQHQDQGGAQIVLLTCTPKWTSQYRLLIFAKLNPQPQP